MSKLSVLKPANRGKGGNAMGQYEAQDEMQVLHEIHRIKRANRAIRSDIQREAHRRPVWQPGDPIPECHIHNQRLRDAAAAAAL